MSFRKIIVSLLSVGLLVSASSAFAQDTKEKDHGPDHDKFAGRFAVGYMGISQLPIGAGAAPQTFGASIPAPVVGMRYWINKQLGIDAGLGFGYLSGSRTQGNTTTDGPSGFGLGLHAGVPIALATAKHYTFEIIPEVNVGFTSGTQKGAPGTPDTNLSGLRFDLGARVGAEVHFGFIGIPELALQATIGLRVTAQSGKSETNGQSTSTSKTEVGTTVQDTPWAIFTNTISALYYF